MSVEVNILLALAAIILFFPKLLWFHSEERADNYEYGNFTG